jgi:hypothetical protein
MSHLFHPIKSDRNSCTGPRAHLSPWPPAILCAASGYLSNPSCAGAVEYHSWNAGIKVKAIGAIPKTGELGWLENGQFEGPN